MLSKIKVKWKCFLKKHMLMNQFCKCCGRDMGYDYHVSDTDWNNNIPKEYQNHVLCIHCFCKKYNGDLNNCEIEFFK